MEHPETAITPSIAVIIPCWCDAADASQSTDAWQNHDAVREIILSGVTGHTSPSPNDSEKWKWCESPTPSRGVQLNCGARAATADILLFHHADSKLTPAHLHAIVRALRDPDIIGGAFYRKFDERHPFLRILLEDFERWHTRAFGTLYGDQSVFVRREVFERIGGYAPIPLMEDVEFSKRLRRAGRIVALDPPMESSPRQQLETGAWRVTFRNLFFLIAFRFGISPARLHEWYYGPPTGQPPLSGVNKQMAETAAAPNE